MKKSGYVAVIGRPNVGKSTLMNFILGQKIAITSRKPQTTRHALYGIHTTENAQIVFIDTPGIHQNAKKSINKQMNRTAKQNMDFVDLIIHVSEVGKWTEEDEQIIELLKGFKQPKIHVINKIDKWNDKSALIFELEKIHQKANWEALIPISAQYKNNLDGLENKIIELLPEQDYLFSEEEITTASMRFLSAETIREKLFRYLHQEVPYELGVIIERYQEKENIVLIDATIIVERESQKAIVIGKGGQTLKLIGQRAREDLEKILEKKVMLKNFVKSKENWRDNEQIINSMGQGNQ